MIEMRKILTGYLTRLPVRYAKNKDGVAALEFAIIAPILILLFIGTLEISLAVAVDRKVSRISSSIADLVTQGDKFTKSEILKIMDIAERIMYPYKDVAKISIIGINIADDKATVAWSCAKNGGQRPGKGSSINVPSQIMVNDTFLLSAIVETDHEPAFKFVGYSADKGLSFDDAAITLSEQMYLRPRIGDAVDDPSC